MKNKITLLNLLTFIFVLGLNGQDCTFKDVNFDYIQLPSKPVKKEYTNYQATVILKYIDDLNSSKGSYQERVKKADDDYARAMENYYIQSKLADNQYNTEIAEWNKRSIAEKILLDKNKPQKRYVSQPYKQMPTEEKYQKTFDTEMLANKYFKLEGFNNNPSNAIILKIKLLGFDSQTPEFNQKEYTKTGTNQPTTKYFKYSYTIKYKHPIGYSIETPSEGLIWEDFPTDMTQYTIVTTPDYESKSQLDSWWSNAKDGYLSNLQEQIINTNLTKIGTTINNMIGFKKINYATELGFVDEKKEYEDLKEAYALALSGYNLLATDQTKLTSIPSLQKAAEIWEKALKESDTENKKARIDADVTTLIEINLLQVYMWMNEFDKAQAYFDKLMILDSGRKNRHRAERLRDFAKELKERWVANK